MSQDRDENEKMYSLEPILQYKMDDQQAKAYKVCLIWMKLCEKILPDYKYTRIPKNGDPRKSHLFRQAWKLLRDTKGLLADEEIGLYIRAQLEILKGIKRSNGAHVLIDPICLSGEKAWIRWKMYKRRFTTAARDNAQTRAEEERTPLFRIAQEIDKTKLFFARFYEGTPTREQVKAMVDDGNLRRWVALGKVSPYYVLLSPFARAAFQGVKTDDYFGVACDLDLYARDVTPEAGAMFRVKFPAEFS